MLLQLSDSFAVSGVSESVGRQHAGRKDVRNNSSGIKRMNRMTDSLPLPLPPCLPVRRMTIYDRMS
jgi:hypothetical protein